MIEAGCGEYLFEEVEDPVEVAAAGDRATAAGVDLPAGELLGRLGVAHRPVAADGAIEGVGWESDRLLRERFESVQAEGD